MLHASSKTMNNRRFGNKICGYGVIVKQLQQSSKKAIAFVILATKGRDLR